MILAQLSGVVEYANCISVEGQDPSFNECPVYNAKPSDGEATV